MRAGVEEMIKFEIPFKVTGEYGMNKIYAGIHWAKRKKQADEIHMLAWSELRRQKIPKKIFEKPVVITIFYNSNLDIDNHGYLTKMLIDGLKGYLIVDDDKKHVDELRQKFHSGKSILIEIEEVQSE